MSKSRVFLISHPTRRNGRNRAEPIDLSPALAYGELVYLFPERPQLNIESVFPEMRKRLSSLTIHDYILPMGGPVLMAWLAIIAKDICSGARILEWDNMDFCYSVLPLTYPSSFIYPPVNKGTVA